MAGTTLGTAYVQIVPSAQGIKGSITNVLGGESEEAGKKAGGIFSSGFGSKITKGLAIGTAAVAGFGAAAGTAITKAAMKTAEMGDHIDKMSQKLGFSTDSFQKWDYVLNLSGTSIDNMQAGIKTLTNKFDDAKNGSASAIEAFERIGLSMDDISSMSREDLFGAAIKQLQGMGDTAERAALANDLFGRSGQELAPLLNQNAEATAEMMENAEKYGMVMSQDAVKASAAFQDSLLTMQNSITGLKTRLTADLLPTMTQVTDGLAKLFSGDMSGLDDVLNAGSQLISKFIEGIMSKAGEIGNKSGELIGVMVNKILAKLPDFIKAAASLASGLLTGLFNALPSIATALGNITAKMIKWLIGGGWKEIGKKILNLIGQGLHAALSALITIVKSVGSSIIQGLGLDKLLQKVKDTVSKIKSFFNFKVSLPHIKLPHFSISPAGWKIGDLLKGSIPKLGISWYAKGGIATSPVIGVGEAGPEAILPLDPFWKKMDNLIEATKSNAGGVTINVYGSPGMNVNELAGAVEQRIIQMQKRRSAAWGTI